MWVETLAQQRRTHTNTRHGTKRNPQIQLPRRVGVAVGTSSDWQRPARNGLEREIRPQKPHDVFLEDPSTRELRSGID